MKQKIREAVRVVVMCTLGCFLLAVAGYAQAVERAAFGPIPAAIAAAVNQFRDDLGSLNPNSGQSFTSGRREINWDGLPDMVIAPNLFPPDFLNVNDPQGIVFSSTSGPNVLGGLLQPMRVSSGGAVAVRFGNINPS